MITGQNHELATLLLLEKLLRLGTGPHRTSVDAGYCIDAPMQICAGSTVRDQFGIDEDDWLAMPSYIERE